MGVGEPKLPTKHTVEKHYHPPLRGFGRVAAAGSFPERTGCAGFVIISRNPRSALFLLWGITPTRQNPSDAKPRPWQYHGILGEANVVLYAFS
jgi:hypothetical protein